jgi:hypothetical protein
MKIGLCAVALCVAAVSTVGCSDTVQATSACSNVENQTQSVRREAFLPCASEMLDALEGLAPLTQASVKGNKQARLDGEAALRHVMPMLEQAGGDRLLERSADAVLSDLRVEIHNTVAKYRAFYALTILPDYHPLAGKARYEAQLELDGATRHFEAARTIYKRLHQG